MVHIKQNAHPSNGDVSPEVADTSAHEVVEVLLALNRETSKDAAPRKCEGHVSSEAETEDSSDEGESESSVSEGFGSESNAKRKAKRAAAATGFTFEFSPSAVVRGCIWAMEHLGYFAKGDAKTPRVEMVPEPNIDEVVVFEDFFSTGLCMPLHLTLVEIMLKFKI
jgi:hypothetical protein